MNRTVPVFFIASTALIWLLTGWWGWLAIILAPFVLGMYYFRSSLSSFGRHIFAAFLLSLVVVFAGSHLQLAAQVVEFPHEWDFPAFWLDGSKAAQGLNFYEPQPQFVAEMPIEPSQAFLEQTAPGFPYPPPSMFLFVPLGAFDFATAHSLWMIFQLLCLAACIYFLWLIFFHRQDWESLLLSAALLLMLVPVQRTIYFGQTNFLTLLMLLLFLRGFPHARGGIWLALAIFTKLYTGILFLFLIGTRSFRLLAGTLGAIAVLVVLALVAFGPDTFLTYFTANPIGERPDYLYVEPVNQSLLAAILRLQGIQTLSGGSPLFTPSFIVLALLLVTATITILWRSGDNMLAYALVIVLGLLLYPAALSHYAVVLIIPVLATGTCVSQSNRYKIVSVLLCFAVYLLTNWQSTTVLASIVTWLTLAALILWPAVRAIPIDVYQRKQVAGLHDVR